MQAGRDGVKWEQLEKERREGQINAPRDCTIMKATTKSPRRPGRGGTAVLLETYQPDAIDVCVAGSFNEWHPQATPMIPLGNGRWAKELTLPPGRYEYRFVVDGQWVSDPKAAASVPNPFGSTNGVIKVGSRG